MSTTYTMQFDEDRFDAGVVLEAIEMGDGTVVSEQDIIDEVAEAMTLAQLDEIGKFVRSTGFAASQAIGVAIRKQDARIVKAMAERKIMMVNRKAAKLVTNPAHARKLMAQGWTMQPAPRPTHIHRYQGVA